MSECEHEWDINWRGKFVYCKNTSTCGAIMTFEEVNRRLNEHAALKRENALMECQIDEALHSIEHARSALLAEEKQT